MFRSLIVAVKATFFRVVCDTMITEARIQNDEKAEVAVVYWLLETIGIEPSETMVNAFLHESLNKGKSYPAYTKGWTYINHWYGCVQVSAHVREPHDGQSGEVVGSDLHISGNFPYKLKVISTLAPMDPDDPMEHRILAEVVNDKDNDEGCTLVVNIVNADRLPSWKDGTVITAQMIAKAISLHVYKDEDEYRGKTSFPISVDAINDGKETPMTYGIGSVFPIGFLNVHGDQDEEETEPDEKDLFEESRMLLTGRVSNVCSRNMLLGDEKIKCYFVLVETDSLGTVELYADFSELTEEELNTLRPGAIVQASVILSADTILKGEETNLPLTTQNNYALLADVFDYPHLFDRLWGAMADDCTYHSDGAEIEIHGKEDILSYLHQKEAQLSSPEYRYHSEFAVLTEVSDGLPHNAGEHCVVLRQGEAGKYVAIVFLSMDEHARIKQIDLSEEPGYHFNIVPYSVWAQES